MIRLSLAVIVSASVDSAKTVKYALVLAPMNIQGDRPIYVAPSYRS